MPKLKKPLPLDKRDLEKTGESGLSYATILNNGLRTENDALVFPYRNLNNEVNGFARTRPHNPRIINGKEVKYEQPAGSPLRAYIPAECVDAIRDSIADVYLTEGELKSLALAQSGRKAIGLGGVYGWKVRDEEVLIPSLAEINWSGRTVYITFDYDEKPKTRNNVAVARRRLAKLLLAAGASEVYNVELPPGPNGAKQGVDDFIVAHGAEAFAELVEQAKPIPVNSPPLLRTPSGRTDAANAARLVARFGDDVRWIGLRDKFLIWDGRLWRLDDELRIHGYAKEVADALWDELKSEIKSCDKATVTAMYSFVKEANNANRIKAMVLLTRSEPGVAIRVEQLDSDPWLLNVENGTLDLRTGELREHRRDDFITKLAPVTFDPKAVCPTWLKFLDVIFADNAELIGYIQRLVGYSLTGVTEEHILPFLYGTGANGKSTFCEQLMRLLGLDYAMKAAPDLLLAKRGESHPTERADLFGKRFVACIETEAGRRMAEALVKELTGGDRIRARWMKENFFEFIPTHHPWLVSNHKPVVVGTDHGIWRRIKMIPFDVVIADADQDKKLPAKLEAEMSGILNWAIEGCLDWRRNGMQEPKIVSDATKGYSDEMDDVGQFLDTSCELGPDFITPATRLFEAFVDETGSRMSQKAFGAELGKRQFASVRITSGPNKAKKGWKGLRLIADAAPQVAAIAAHIAKKAEANKGTK